MTYKVALPRGRWKYGFMTLDAAVAYASRIHRRTGVFVAVEAYTPHKPRKR